MSMAVRERYEPRPLAASATVDIPEQSMGFFLCTTAGTITITRKRDGLVLAVLAANASIYYPLPIFFGAEGGTVTSSGGAGLLGI